MGILIHDTPPAGLLVNCPLAGFALRRACRCAEGKDGKPCHWFTGMLDTAAEKPEERKNVDPAMPPQARYRLACGHPTMRQFTVLDEED